MGDFVPRRDNVDQMTPSETAITVAMVTLEKAGSDRRLTKAMDLLNQARNLVADYIDGIDDGIG